MEKETLNKILDEHKEWLITGGKKGKKADLSHTDLRGADLSHADLRYSNLHHTDLHYSYLHHTNLRYSDLRLTDLRHTDLCYSDLTGANLGSADLTDANLRDANLNGANLDYSVFPLWCGGLDVHIDDRQATQLLYHLVRNVLYSKNTSESLKKLCSLKSLVSQANKFHRVDECGHIDLPEE